MYLKPNLTLIDWNYCIGNKLGKICKISSEQCAVAILEAGLMSTYSRNNPPHSPLLVYIIRTFLHRLVLSAGGMQWWYCHLLPVLPHHMMKLATRRSVPGSARVKVTRGKYSDDAMRADLIFVKGWGSLTFSKSKRDYFMNLTWENVGVGHYRINPNIMKIQPKFMFGVKGP